MDTGISLLNYPSRTSRETFHPEAIIRVFIALPLPVHIAEHLADIGMALKDMFRGVKPVHAHAVHLTLSFLGEQTEERIEMLKSLMADELLAHSVFTAHLTSAGTFPPYGTPKIIWAGIDAGAGAATNDNALITYQHKVKKLLVENGFPEADEKRPFHPHLTIARNRFAVIPQSVLDGFSLNTEVFEIDTCALFESRLHPWGAEYHKLAIHEFSK
ncbi:MAG: RNA 2',3'-cyclic phosphodiesterase [Spirochaetales bacterium]|nr:RNA 2',3'-cyclic phosphodiesterase [Spirochaetales bacterium]